MMSLLAKLNALLTSQTGFPGTLRRLVWGHAALREPLRLVVRAVRLGMTSAATLGGHVQSRRLKIAYVRMLSAREPRPIRYRAVAWAVLGYDWTPQSQSLPVRLKAIFWLRDRFRGAEETYAPFLEESLSRQRTKKEHSNSLATKAGYGAQLNIALVNDIGFQYGAGVALRRQVASFLLMGWRVHLISFSGPEHVPPTVTGVQSFAGWQGGQRVGDTRSLSLNTATPRSISEALREIAADAVVLGNLHGLVEPIETVRSIVDCGAPVFAYMHDSYWVTGRCAAPLDCRKFLTVCDKACPTSHEYPSLSPERITEAWNAKAQLVTGISPIELVANSSWTLELARQRYGEAARTSIARLGIDHWRFAPMSKRLARRILGVPSDRPVIAMGAVDLSNHWKGGPIFNVVHAALSQRDDVHLILFGAASKGLKAAKAFGYVNDDHFLSLILNCADIFVSTAIAESFGQVLMEAAACGVATVAIDVGGVSDIVVHEETGLLVKEQLAAAVLRAINVLLEDKRMLFAFGNAGRRLVEDKYTLMNQARAWEQCFSRSKRIYPH